MQSTYETHWEKGLAIVVALAAQVGLAWVLSKTMRFDPPAPAETAMQVVWIPRQPWPVASPVSEARPVRRPERSSQTVQPAPSSMAALPAAPTQEKPLVPAQSGAPSLSAQYVTQAGQWARDTDSRPAADPFADRPVALPGAGDGRFRMRPRPSPAAVVAQIGKWLGGQDTDTPCRENRDNIATLAAQGDSRALQQQLEYERRLCRP